MKPGNEAANIVEACQLMDLLLQKKYMIMGGAIAGCVELHIVAIVVLFMQPDYFLVAFVLPLLLQMLADKYVTKLNKKISMLTEIIRINHEQNKLRSLQNFSNNQRNEV